MLKSSLRDYSFKPRSKPDTTLVAGLIAVLIVIVAVAPMTASCQRSSTDPNRGLDELSTIVDRAAGKPSAVDLTHIESKYPKSRAAGLAALLRGYLYYSSQNYQAALEPL